MQVALENNIVFVVIEYLAILCWGLSGGLAAIRKGYDIFTIMLCGWLTALGGGLVRDVMLGALPPVGITDKGYVLTTLFSGIIVVVAHPEITNLKWTMTVIDVWRGVSYGWFDMRSEMLLDVLIVIIVVALRLLSVGFNVTLPGAVERHRVYLPSESRYLKRPVIHPHADTGDTPNTKDEEDKPQDGSRPPLGSLPSKRSIWPSAE